MRFSFVSLAWTSLAFNFISRVSAFDATAADNVVVYWGQSSAGSQESLGTYCESDSVDIILLSFMIGYTDTPDINFSSACTDTYSNGVKKCDQIAADILTCQAAGKKVMLSLGGATGSYGFSSDDEGKEFATTLWDLFGEGSSDFRPFGDSIIDGFDLDLENKDQVGYVSMLSALREYFATSEKDYYISAAPQCVYPDESLSDVLENSNLDFVFIQFYNNYCSVDKQFNWDTWADYASSTSKNSNVRIYLGLPGASSAAGSGYVDISTVASTLSTISSSSNFGGVMLWDASQGFTNMVDGVAFVCAIKSALTGTSSSSNASSGSSATTSTAVNQQSSAINSATSAVASTADFTASAASEFTSAAADFTASAASEFTSAAADFTASAASEFTSAASEFTSAAAEFTASAASEFTSAAAEFTSAAAEFTASAASEFTSAASESTATGEEQEEQGFSTQYIYRTHIISATSTAADGTKTTDGTSATTDSNTHLSSINLMKKGASVALDTTSTTAVAASTSGVSTRATTTLAPSTAINASQSKATTTLAASTTAASSQSKAATSALSTVTDVSQDNASTALASSAVTSSPESETTTTTASYSEITSNTFSASDSTLSTIVVSGTASATFTSTQATATSSASGSSCDGYSGEEKVSCLNALYEDGKFDGSPTQCTDGEVACDGSGNFAVCDRGSWVISACANGTTCYAYILNSQIATGCSFERSS